jgi:hypothetical protein
MLRDGAGERASRTLRERCSTRPWAIATDEEAVIARATARALGL